MTSVGLKALTSVGNLIAMTRALVPAQRGPERAEAFTRPRLALAVVAAACLLGPAAPLPAHAAAPCSRHQANTVGRDQLASYASRNWPYFYGRRGIRDSFDEFVLRGVRCRDLTGDGRREMAAYFVCCTGGSPSPWAIYKLDRRGEWHLRFARVRKPVYRLAVRGRKVLARSPAPYDGAFTRYLRDLVVTWRGGRFAAHKGPRIRRG